MRSLAGSERVPENWTWKNENEWSDKNLHGCQDQKDGEIDLNDHVNIVHSKEPCSDAYNKKEGRRHKHSDQIADDWPTQDDLTNDGIHVVNGWFAHSNPAYEVAVERYAGIVLE